MPSTQHVQKPADSLRSPAARKRGRGYTACRLAAVVGAVIAWQTARGQTLVTWASGVSGEYLDPTKWIGPVPNSTAFDALISAPGNYEVFASVQPITVGKFCVDAPGARFVQATMVATRGVEVLRGSVGFRNLVAPFLVSGLTGQTGSVGVSGTGFDVAEYGGRVGVSGSTISPVVTLRPNTQMEVQGGTLAFTAPNARLEGTGSIRLVQSVLRGTPDAPLVVGPGITIINNYPNTVSPTFGIHNVVFRGTLIADMPSGVPTFSFQAFGSFSGRNEGVIRNVERSPLLREFTGTNSGLLELTGFDGTLTTPLNLVNFTNTGTTTLTRVRPQFVGTATIASGSTFRVVEGMLTLDQTVINTPSGLAGITLVNSRINPSTFDVGGGTLDTSNFPLLLSEGLLRNGTLVGSAGSIEVVRGRMENIRLGVATTISSANLDVTGSIELLQPLTAAGGGVLGLPLRVPSGATFSGVATLIISSSQQLGATSGIAVAEGAILAFDQNFNTVVDASYALITTLGTADPSRNSAVVNRGTVTVSPDSVLQFNTDTLTNQGLIRLRDNSTLVVAVGHLGDLGSIERSSSSSVTVSGCRDFGAATFDLANTPVGGLDLSDVNLTGGRLISEGRTVKISRLGGTGNNRFNNTTLALVLLADIGTRIGGSPLLDDAELRFRGSTLAPDNETVSGTGSIVFVDLPNGQLNASRLPSTVALSVRAGASATVQPLIGRAINLDGPIGVEGGALNLGTSTSSTSPIVLNNRAVVTGGGRIVFNQTTTVSASGSVEVRSGDLVFTDRVDNLGLIKVDSGSSLRMFSAPTGLPIKMDGTLMAARGIIPLAVLPEFGPTSAIGGVIASNHFFAGGFSVPSALNVSSLEVVVELVVDSLPNPGNSYVVLSYASRVGNFRGFRVANPNPAISLIPTFGATSVAVRVQANFPGDANLDTFVGSEDLRALGAHFGFWGVGWRQGNFNGDFLVDIDDLRILTLHWQGTPEQYASLVRQYNLPWVPLPIPEPAALGLAVLGLPFLGRHRRV